MQTIFHFAGLSRCRDCLQLNQVKMSVRLYCACDFIWPKKWRIKLQTPQWDYETQRAYGGGNGLLDAFSRTKILCLRQKKLLRLLPLWVWDVGVDSLIRWDPLHKQWTRPRALQIRFVSLSFSTAAAASNFVGDGRQRWENSLRPQQKTGLLFEYGKVDSHRRLNQLTFNQSINQLFFVQR